MAPDMNALKERFFSYLSPSLFNGISRILDSAPFTWSCLCGLLVPLALALLFSAAYVSSFLYGVACGHALPSREIFLFFPGLATVFAPSSGLAKLLFFYALTGAVLSLLLQREQQQEFVTNILNALGKHWNIVSCLIIFSLIFATLGEEYFASSSNYFTLAGSLPYSDSNDHYISYTKYFYDGVMRDWVLRRPMAAFMGAAIHWLAGNDAGTAVQLRCLLLSFAIWASCAVMNKSFGVWSAVACMALEYAYLSYDYVWTWAYTYLFTYLHTFMNEPLGFFWGCIAAALWLQALREKYLFWDLAAFSATLVGLLVRMGSMFLVPTLFLYVLWRWRKLHPGHGWWKKPLLGLCACTAAIFLLNMTLASHGAADRQQTGSNYSYCFAGLTLGTDWVSAEKYYIEKLRTLKNEKQKSRFLYKEGIKNILRSPGVFIKRLAQGEVEFITNSNCFLFRNWYLVGLVAVLLVFRRKTVFSKSSPGFWVAVWAGILTSIPFIYFDESWRVNIFAYPFIACFFSLALGRRQVTGGPPDVQPLAVAPWLAMALPGALLLLMTSVALFPQLHTSGAIQRILKYKSSLPQRAPHTYLVDSKGMGFLVVPDGEELDPTIPSMTWSTFQERYHKFASGVDKAWFTDVFPKPPFVAYTQVPVSGGSSGYDFFIAPPDLLSDKNVLLWDFKTDGEISDSSTYVRWKVVRSATPVLYK